MTTEIEREPHERDPRSTAQLIEAALLEDEEADSYWSMVWTLNGRVSPETFEMARGLCESDEIKHRALGANILALLGYPPDFPVPPFKEETLGVLLALLDEPRNAESKMLGTLISALGHLKDERTAAPVVRFKNHPEADVRFSVAVSLGGLECDIAIESMIELSQDEHPDVRDWATFGFGTQTEVDTPEVRNALLNRLDDLDGDTRNEAIRGLAQRKDRRVIEALIRELEMENPHSLAIEAAYELASSELLPALLQLKAIDEKSGIQDSELDKAIAQCQSKLT